MRTLRRVVMTIALCAALSAAGSAATSSSDVALVQRGVTVVLLDKGFIPTDPRSGVNTAYITLRFSITNNTKLDLQAMTGDVQFNDPKGAVLDSEPFDDVDVIKAHSKIVYNARVQYHEYILDTVQLAHARASDLKVLFYPHGMFFTNGLLVGSMQHSLYCQEKSHTGFGPCAFDEHP